MYWYRMNCFVAKYGFLLLLFLFVSQLITNCSDRNIAPFEEDAGFYSVYGALNMDDSTHYIRVNNVQTPVIDEMKEGFNGTVLLLKPENGFQTELRDTIVNFSGFVTHNFMIEEPLEPAVQYLLIVESPLGNRSTTTVTTPAQTKVVIHPSDNVRCETQINFTFKNVSIPEHIRMEVGFNLGGEIHWSEIGFVDQLKHQSGSDEMFVRLSPRNLLVEVFPPSGVPSTRDPRTVMPIFTCSDLDSNIAHIRYTHFGPEWDIYSPGFFPIDPLEWQDVEGGLGFLGAFREGSTTFTIQN